jgi:hypothetical protein
LIVLPWYQDDHEKSEDKVPRCSDCRDSVSEAMRRDMGCGWLATSWEGDPAPSRWVHSSGASPRCVTCPGFTTALPEVLEVLDLFSHWETGQIEFALGGETASSMLPRALALAKRACGALMASKTKREPR